MLLDFLLFRHLRVVKARLMRRVHKRRTEAAGYARVPVRGAYDVTMWPDWNDRTFAYCHYATYGNYLSDILARIDVPFAFLDIGANQGLFSLVAARNPHCRRIVALEPVPRTFAKLEANFALGGLEDRALAVNAALADHSGSAEIALKPEHSGAASLRENADFGGPCQTIRLFSIAQLDPLLPDDLPIFVKIDIEGYEPVAIEQLLQSVHAERMTAMFYEMDERWSDAQAVQAMLRAAGFGGARKFGIGRHYDMLATRGQPDTKWWAHDLIHSDARQASLLPQLTRAM